MARSNVELGHMQSLLERVVGNQGIEVHYEAMGEGPGTSAGGLCRLHTRRMVLIDAGAPRVEQVGVLLDALGQLDLEAMFVLPLIRRMLSRRRR